MKVLLFACLASVGQAVILERTPFKRLIPADVLRGDEDIFGRWFGREELHPPPLTQLIGVHMDEGTLKTPIPK
jgi:hypothetical protein